MSETMGTARTTIVQVASKATKKNALFNFSLKEFSKMFTILITYMGLSI